jgi:ubiquinone/menaquinone biosynthesis C-methylase UbiE
VAQKDVFLQSEGNAWFNRNRDAVARRKLPEDDAVLQELLDFWKGQASTPTVLEIGCGEGARLGWLKEHLHAECLGIEPSANAIAVARARGIDARQGTADALPFADGSVDIVIFGFCLYLVDRQDLFRVASEADRVLRSPGWIVIEDFYSPTPRLRAYHHQPGVWSYKMDYRTLFVWHPHYECLTHKVRHHGQSRYTDDPEEWVALSVLRKAPKPPA